MTGSFFLQPPHRLLRGSLSRHVVARPLPVTGTPMDTPLQQAALSVVTAAKGLRYSDIGVNFYNLSTGALTNTYRQGWIPVRLTDAEFPALESPRYIDARRPSHDEKAEVLKKIMSALYDPHGESRINPAAEKLFISVEHGFGTLYIFDRTIYPNFEVDRQFYPRTSPRHLAEILYLFPLTPVQIANGEMIFPLFQFANWSKNRSLFTQPDHKLSQRLERLGILTGKTFQELQWIQPYVLQQAHQGAIESRGDQHRQRLGELADKYRLGVLWDSPVPVPSEFVTAREITQQGETSLVFSLGAVYGRHENSSPYLPFKVADFIELGLAWHPEWTLEKLYTEINRFYAERVKDEVAVFLGQIHPDLRLTYISSLQSAYHVRPGADPTIVPVNAPPLGTRLNGIHTDTIRMAQNDMIFLHGLGCAHTLSPETEPFGDRLFGNLLGGISFSSASEGARWLRESIGGFSKEMPRSTDWTALFVPTPQRFKRTWKFTVPQELKVYIPSNDLIVGILKAIREGGDAAPDKNALNQTMSLIEEALQTQRPLSEVVNELRYTLATIICDPALLRTVDNDIHNFLCNCLKDNIRSTIESQMRQYGFSEDRVFDFAVAFGEAMANIIDYGSYQDASYVTGTLSARDDGIRELTVELFSYAKPSVLFRVREQDERGMGQTLMNGSCTVSMEQNALEERPFRRVILTLTNDESESPAEDYSHFLNPELLSLIADVSQEKESKEKKAKP